MSENKEKTSMSGVQRLIEVGLIVTIVFAVFILLSLITFHSGDPSWSQSEYQGDIKNAMGNVGAWLSDLLLTFLGWVAYIIPISVGFLGWALFKSDTVSFFEIDFLALGLRLIGLILLIVSTTALVSLNVNDIYNFSSGGLAGDVISASLTAYFNFVGSTLLLLCFFFTGVTLMFGVSWLDLIEKIGEMTVKLGLLIWAGMKSLTALFSGSGRMVNEPALATEGMSINVEEPSKEIKENKNISSKLNSVDDLLSPPEISVKKEKKSSFVSLEKEELEADDSLLLNHDNKAEIKPEEERSQVDEKEKPSLMSRFLFSKKKKEDKSELTSDIDITDVLPEDDQLIIAEKDSDKLNDLPSTSAVNNADEMLVDPEPNQQDSSPIPGETLSEQDDSRWAPKYEEPKITDLDRDLEDDGRREPSIGTVDQIDLEELLHSTAPTPTEAPVIEKARVKVAANGDASQVHNNTPPPAATPALNGLAALPAVPPKPEGRVPSFELLDRADKKENPITQEAMDAVARLVEAKLLDFGVTATVVGMYPGPVITRLELDLAPGVKVSKITNISKDIARSLSAVAVRVVEVIPGKSYIGLELPNKHREIVRMSEVIEGPEFEEAKSPLAMVLGQDIAGKPVVTDLGKMPHLLVAGTTGSGKSVGVNTMILSLLFKSTPEQVRLIMIDPKMLELSVYEGIPHLLCEVVTDMKEASNALRWCVGEMERRYKLMSAMGVRNLKGFNKKIEDAIEQGQPLVDPLWKPGDSMDETAPMLEALPSIVVVIDEFADMMMIVGKKVEELIARIAQKARAAGIHLILATQRPSVDVITGLIKANIPTRIAFQVSSRIDSRTILDQQGAENLLGMGDMLYLPAGTSVPTRVHGAFVDDHEVHAVVADWKARGKPRYIDEILNGEDEILLPGEQSEAEAEDSDPLYDDAVAFVTETRKVSVSSVQRKFRIGYNRAARIVEQMEMTGVVSSAGHNGSREVLAAAPPKD